MEIIFLLGAVQAFFFGFLIVGVKNNGRHHKLLFLFFSIIGLVLIEHFLFEKDVMFSHPHLLGITYTLPIILGPILFYYTKSLINENNIKLFPWVSVHTFPFFTALLFFIFDFYFLSPQEKLIYYERESLGTTSIPIYIAEFFINFSVPIYSIASLYLLKNHLKKIKQNFSTTKNIDLHWLKVVLICMIIISFVSVLMGLLSDYLNFITYQDGDNILYISITIVIYFLGYYGIKQKPIFINSNILLEEDNTKTTKPKYENSSLKSATKDYLIQHLENYMEEKKPYLTENLTLKQLADGLEILPNNLSQIINEGYNKNFFQFVNEYRVIEVKRMLSDPKYSHYSILGIAYECGFNSKSTFNSIFKKMVGNTPSEYKNNIP